MTFADWKSKHNITPEAATYLGAPLNSVKVRLDRSSQAWRDLWALSDYWVDYANTDTVWLVPRS